jgi:acyl dehydratase
VGQTFGSSRLTVDQGRIESFAAEFNPQPFHLDEEAARGSIFRGLAASGWHTAAITMKLLVESELRWPRPVRPGDELRVHSEVLEIRRSRSRPTQGMVKVRITTLNQNDEAVQVSVSNISRSVPFVARLAGRSAEALSACSSPLGGRAMPCTGQPMMPGFPFAMGTARTLTNRKQSTDTLVHSARMPTASRSCTA